MLITAGIFLALHFLGMDGFTELYLIASSTIILSLEPVFVMEGAYFAFETNRING